MAAATSLLAGVVVVLLLAARAGSGLKCYSCFMKRSVSPRCGDPFSRPRSSDYLVDCDDVRPSGQVGYSFCKKVKQIKDRSLIVTRMCDWSLNETKVCDKVPPGTEDLELLHCSACRLEGCNGCRALLPTSALALPLLLLLFAAANR